VIDDCSSDDTRQIVQTLARKDARIHLLPDEKNMGTARTRNRGMDLCHGVYIALLDSDDVWYPQKLQQQIDLAEETGADIVYCSYAMVDQQRKPKCPDFIVPAETDLEEMLVKSVISCSTALLRRSSVGDSRFPEDYYHEDYAFWLHLLQRGLKARGTTDVLAEYRLIENSRASNKLASAVRRWHIYREFLDYSVWRSAKYLARYAFAGCVKYRKKQ
jgi:teichuronic acid biosynthesis glycosyltransferase TuaG